MSDCLPCQKKLDPAFVELMKQRKRDFEEAQNKVKEINPSMSKGVTLEITNNEETIKVHTAHGVNEYTVISKNEGNLVVKFDKSRPIPPHLSHVNINV